MQWSSAEYQQRQQEMTGAAQHPTQAHVENLAAVSLAVILWAGFFPAWCFTSVGAPRSRSPRRTLRSPNPTRSGLPRTVADVSSASTFGDSPRDDGRWYRVGTRGIRERMRARARGGSPPWIRRCASRKDLPCPRRGTSAARRQTKSVGVARARRDRRPRSVDLRGGDPGAIQSGIGISRTPPCLHTTASRVSSCEIARSSESASSKASSAPHG